MEKKRVKPAKKVLKAPVRVEEKEPGIKKLVRRPKVKAEVKVGAFGLHSIGLPKGAHKKKKLLGRGPGSGHGKTSTRGSKGQTSRAGRHFYLGFEGGQSPLIRKMPKRGFRNQFRKIYQIVNIERLNSIKEAVITPEVLRQRGMIASKDRLVKILGEGQIKAAVTIQAHAFSKSAADAIAAAGGKAEIINV